MSHTPPNVLLKLYRYSDLLVKWQNSINLVSDSTLANLWNRHFVDSLQLSKFISKSAPRIVDVGSGGGFPGLVLAIAIQGEIHLVESDKRKCIFLSEVSRETDTKVIIHNDRVERLSIPNIDYITSRACAKVSQILSWTEKLVSHETKYLLLKGKNFPIEIDEAKKDWQFDIAIHPSVTEKDSAILELSHIRRREK